MKKIRILASEFASDVKAGASDAVLMRKYGLSARSLLKVKTELLIKGLVSVEDVGAVQPETASPRVTIRARDFLESFSKNPNDFVLMAEYAMNPGQLRKVYEMLIKKGLLSEYELNARTGKAPEIDGGTFPKHEDSTSITWKTEPVEVGRDSTEIRKFLLSLADEDGSYRETSKQSDNGWSRGAGNRGNTHSGPGSCPKCGHPKDPSTPESCSRCGVVYAKIGKIARTERISAWKEHFETR